LGGAIRCLIYSPCPAPAGTEVETLEAITRADTSAMTLTGNAINNMIVGNDVANMLDDKGGNDLLVGYGGADMFAFTTAPGAGNVDHLYDFVSGTDKIALDDAIFGALGAGAFAFGAQAGEADDRIIYNTATGELFFDADGNGGGAQVLFAVLDTHPALVAGDFTVI
jgi:Ca2+-binding RTX toxin-like protein